MNDWGVQELVSLIEDPQVRWLRDLNALQLKKQT